MELLLIIIGVFTATVFVLSVAFGAKVAERIFSAQVAARRLPRAAQQLGLRRGRGRLATGAIDGFNVKVEARRGQLEVSVASPRLPPIWIRPGTHEHHSHDEAVMTGDPVFDLATAVGGPAALVHAHMDVATRALIGRCPASLHLEPGRTLRCAIGRREPAEVSVQAARKLTALAKDLTITESTDGLLIQNIRTDPRAGVRLRTLAYVIRSYRVSVTDTIGDEATGILAAIVRDTKEPKEDRLEALSLLVSEFAPERVGPTISAILDDWLIGPEALQALTKIRWRPALVRVRDLLGSDDEKIALGAIAVIEQMGEINDVTVLMEAAKGGSRRFKKTAEGAIEALQTPVQDRERGGLALAGSTSEGGLSVAADERGAISLHEDES